MVCGYAFGPGFGALHCQPSSNFDRSTNVEFTTVHPTIANTIL